MIDDNSRSLQLHPKKVKLIHLFCLHCQMHPFLVILSLHKPVKLLLHLCSLIAGLPALITRFGHPANTSVPGNPACFFWIDSTKSFKGNGIPNRTTRSTVTRPETYLRLLNARAFHLTSSIHGANNESGHVITPHPQNTENLHLFNPGRQ